MNQYMEIIKDKKATLLIINEVKCVVQSYAEGDFVNLSPICIGRESVEDCLGNVRIDFVKYQVSTEGKENVRWKEFASALNIDEISNILKTGINMNKTFFCEKCHKWHTIAIAEEQKFVICPNQRCGHLIFI